jgi:hypothetical protein
VFLLLDMGTDGWSVRDSDSPAEPDDLGDAPDWLPEEPTALG